MSHRASGYRDDDLPKQIRCPDCGLVNVHPDVFERGVGVSAECPECKERLYFAEPPVFTTCNVCGIKLKGDELDAEMGMCFRCADE